MTNRKSEDTRHALSNIIGDGEEVVVVDVMTLLREIDAPQHCRGIIDVAKNLSMMLKSYGHLADASGQNIVRVWTSIADRVLERTDEILRAEPSAQLKRDERRIYGLYTKNPIYAMLWHTPALAEKHPEAHNQYLAIQALCLLWYIVRGRNHSSKHFRYFAIEVRRLSEKGALAESVLLHLPDRVATIGAYLSALHDLRHELGAEIECAKHLDLLIQMVESLQGKVTLSSRTRKGAPSVPADRSTVGDRLILEEEDCVDLDIDDEDGVPGKTVTFTYHERKKGRRPPKYEDDCIGRTRIAARQKSDEMDSGYFTINGYEMNVRYAHAALDRHRNTEYGIFGGIEESTMSRLYAALVAERPSTAQELVQWLLVLFIFISGRRSSSLRNLRLYSGLPRNPRLPYADLGRGVLVLPATKLIKYQRPPRGEFRYRHRPGQNQIVLVIPPQLLDAVNAVYAKLLPVGRRQRLRPFARVPDTESILRRWLERQNREMSIRATNGGLQRAFFGAIQRHPNGGEAMAAIVCDRITPTIRNHLHYRYHDLGGILRVHHDVCHSLLSGTERQSHAPIVGHIAEVTGEGVGARVVPVTVKPYVTDLIELVNSKRAIASRRDAVDFHNAYTFYLMELLYFATAHRPTYSAFGVEQDFDIVHKLLLVRDKDKWDGRNMRIVPLTDVCCRSLQAYRQHVARLDHVIRRFANESRRRKAERVKPGNIGRLDYVKRTRPFVFYLDSDSPECWELRAVSDIEQLRQPFIGSVANMQRHHLAKRLAENACRDVYIQALLGHWHASMSPYSSFSALSVDELMTILRAHLTKITEEDGWRVLSGIQ